MPAPDFFAFLERSMRLLEVEAPANYAVLGARLAGLRVCLETGGLQRVASFDQARFSLTAADGASDVEASFARDVVLDLVDGATSLENAILNDRLCLRGPVEAVERFYDGVCLYVDAAIRSPGFEPLLDEYRLSSER